MIKPTPHSDKGPHQQHFKSNYIEVLKRIVPEFYEETEYQLFGKEEDLQYNVLARILSLANNLSSVIATPITTTASSFSSNLALVPFFVPFNNLTDVSPSKFEQHILRPLGRRFNSFTNEKDFTTFITTSALPATHLNLVTEEFATSYSSLVDNTASSIGLVQDRLIDEFGWVYLMNTSGLIADAVDNVSISPSSVLVSSLSEQLFYGKNLTTESGVSDIIKWLALNAQGGRPEWETVRSNYLPAPFNAPSATYSENYWASGGQLVSALDTLVKVWVNEDDPNSLYFRDIVNASLLGLPVTRMEDAGPLGKMLKALAYSMYDIKTTIKDVQYLLDIDECPPQFLEYLGRYLGWTFFTDDPANWRDQLKQAIYLYKAKGTRQALAAACNMVIPSSVYNPNNSEEGLQELWTSYFPNLIYYTIKTETDLATNPESYLALTTSWRNRLEASGVEINTRPYDPINYDNNARYVVDFILQYLEKLHKFLYIGSVGFKDTAFYTGQLSATAAFPDPDEKAGYFYRGYDMAIPPWEEHRFYQNCQVTEPIVRDMSSLFARPIEDLGLGISTSASQQVAEYIVSSIGIKNQDGLKEPGYGDNNSFEFMSSSLNLPYNYASIIKNGNVDGMSVFDFWNAKSSEVHSKFDLSAIDGSNDHILNIAKDTLGRKGLGTIIDIFRQFAPFHVLNKIYVGSGITDNYGGLRNNAQTDAPTSAWSGTVDLQIINTIQSDADQFNSSYAHDGFPGTQGAETGYFSSVGIAPSVYNPKQGRWIPSATLFDDGFFWSGGTKTGTSALKALTNIPRTAGRRKNLKYKFTGWAQNREGLNQPGPTDFFLTGTNTERMLYIPGFVPKGFNFSSQDFVSPSGSLSSVYSPYNTSATPFFEFAGSSNFPVRAVSDVENNASSWTQMRDVFGSPILRSLTQIFLRRGEQDSRWLDFTNTGFQNFKFGHEVLALYQAYNTTFRRQLTNRVIAATLQPRQEFAGGFNLLSHVFGPGLFNNNYSIKGDIISNMSAIALDQRSGSISSVNFDWSAVVATESIANDYHLFTSDGNGKDLSQGILQAGGYNTFQHPLDIFELPSQVVYSNGALLSGIELVAPNVNSLAVWNAPENTSYNVDNTKPNGLTLIQRHSTNEVLQGMRVRFPLNGNMNYSYNGKFKFPPLDGATTNPSLSSIAGWQLVDVDRAPQIAQYKQPSVPVGNSRRAQFQFTPGASALPIVVMSGKGRGNVGGAGTKPLGNQQNPALLTVAQTQDRQTPRNLRSLEPSTRYTIKFEASSLFTGGTPYIVGALFNTTKGKHWTGTTWAKNDVAVSGNDIFGYASGTDPATSAVQNTLAFREYVATFTTDYQFEKGDSYQLWTLPINTNAAQAHTVGVRDISVRYEGPQQTTKSFYGTDGNRLFPDQEYNLNIKARVASLTMGLSGVDETLYTRVVVEQKPFVGNGWENFAKSWVYNWSTKMWEDRTTSPAGEHWKPLEVSSFAASGQEFGLEFNTFNWRTPLRYFSLGGPLNGYFTSAGPVHDDNSVYYIEIGKPKITGLNNGVTLLDTSLVNKNYNIYAKDYSRKDFMDVFEFFDELNMGKASRAVQNSSGTYLRDGGSRNEYMGYWGGSHSATDGVYGFIDNEG